jgi:AraC-like DNA-binding protein
LQAACRDLAETDKPITEIAYPSGFGQLTFFYRFFRRQIGCTPKAFRDAKRMDADSATDDAGNRHRPTQSGLASND